MKRLIISAIAVFLGIASTGFADDRAPQPWVRQSDGTTYQSWDFSTSDYEPAPDSSFYNPYGTPTLFISENSLWSDGVWSLSREIDVGILNRPNPFEKKEIWLQLTWMENQEDLSHLPPIPQIGATGIPMSDHDHSEIFNKGTIDLQDGWKHTTYEINLYPNPEAEWISIKGDISVDQLVIDTRCIPEPATIVLLGAGALITAFRRKKAA